MVNFGCLYILERLQTRYRLHKHINSIYPTNPMCNVGVEKPDRLFMNCNFARQVCATLPEINPTNTSNVVSLLEWLHSLDCNDNENLSKLSLALLICSQIWKEIKLYFEMEKQYLVELLCLL